MSGQKLSRGDRGGERSDIQYRVSVLSIRSTGVEFGVVRSWTNDLTWEADRINTDYMGDRVWGAWASFVEPEELGIGGQTVLPELVRLFSRQDCGNILREDGEDDMGRRVGSGEANVSAGFAGRFK